MKFILRFSFLMKMFYIFGVTNFVVYVNFHGSSSKGAEMDEKTYFGLHLKFPMLDANSTKCMSCRESKTASQMPVAMKVPLVGVETEARK